VIQELLFGERLLITDIQLALTGTVKKIARYLPHLIYLKGKGCLCIFFKEGIYDNKS
jgi:hypothetical protein